MPDINDISEDEKKVLEKILNMTSEELEAHFRLIKEEPAITAFFSRRKAYALIFGSIHKAILWAVGLMAAVGLGFEKVKAFLVYVLQLLTSS